MFQVGDLVREKRNAKFKLFREGIYGVVVEVEDNSGRGRKYEQEIKIHFIADDAHTLTEWWSAFMFEKVE